MVNKGLTIRERTRFNHSREWFCLYLRGSLTSGKGILPI